MNTLNIKEKKKSYTIRNSKMKTKYKIEIIKVKDQLFENINKIDKG